MPTSVLRTIFNNGTLRYTYLGEAYYFCHLEQFLNQGLYENTFGAIIPLLILFYTLITRKILKPVVVVKLRNGDLGRPYSIRLEV